MKKLISCILGAMLLATVFGCSSMRLQYAAKIETTDGKRGKFTYEKSYNTRSLKIWCPLTAIFYGGACWFYLVMPTTGDNEIARSDAYESLDQLIGDGKYVIKSEKLSRLSWSGGEATHELSFYSGEGAQVESTPK